MQQLGYTIDIPRFFELIAEYSDTPEVRQLVRLLSPQEQMMAQQSAEQASGERPLQSPVTTRRNIRENQGGGDGASDLVTQLLASSPGGGEGNA